MSLVSYNPNSSATALEVPTTPIQNRLNLDPFFFINQAISPHHPLQTPKRLEVESEKVFRSVKYLEERENAIENQLNRFALQLSFTPSCIKAAKALHKELDDIRGELQLLQKKSEENNHSLSLTTPQKELHDPENNSNTMEIVECTRHANQVNVITLTTQKKRKHGSSSLEKATAYSVADIFQHKLSDRLSEAQQAITRYESSGKVPFVKTKLPEVDFHFEYNDCHRIALHSTNSMSNMELEQLENYYYGGHQVGTTTCVKGWSPFHLLLRNGSSKALIRVLRGPYPPPFSVKENQLHPLELIGYYGSITDVNHVERIIDLIVTRMKQTEEREIIVAHLLSAARLAAYRGKSVALEGLLNFIHHSNTGEKRAEDKIDLISTRDSELGLDLIHYASIAPENSTAVLELIRKVVERS